MEITLKCQLQDNFLLPIIRTHAQGLEKDPAQLVRGAIELWGQLSMQHRTGDPCHGFGMDDNVTIDADGFYRLKYDEDLADQQQLIPDLGQLAIFMISDMWQAPSDPDLREAHLLASTTTTMLFGAFAFLPYVAMHPWETILKLNADHSGLKMFLQTAWKTCRPVKPSKSPAVEFRASLNGSKLSQDGKRILTQDGQELPYWHPTRRVPGSHWNKFLRNHAQPIFSTRVNSPPFRYKVPSSVLIISQTFENFYYALRERFDQVSATPGSHSCSQSKYL